MAIFYHGSSILFERYDLTHVLKEDGKVKFRSGREELYISSIKEGDYVIKWTIVDDTQTRTFHWRVN